MRFLITSHNTHLVPLAARLSLTARAEEWKPPATQPVQHVDISVAAYADAEEMYIRDTNLISLHGDVDDIELQSLLENDLAAVSSLN